MNSHPRKRKKTKRMWALIQKIGNYWYGSNSRLLSERVIAERQARYLQQVEQWETKVVPVDVPLEVSNDKR